MPNIYKHDGFTFFFYSNEKGHEPHCHVRNGGRILKVEITSFHGRYLLDLVEKTAKKFNHQELKKIVDFVKGNGLGIIEKWDEYFNQNKKVKCEEISGKQSIKKKQASLQKVSEKGS